MDDIAIRQFCELLMQLIANLESDSPLAARAIAQNIDLKK
jgi:hypothetical protein